MSSTICRSGAIPPVPEIGRGPRTIIPESAPALGCALACHREAARQLAIAPSLLDYDRTQAEVSWPQTRAALDGLPDGRGLNIAHKAVDRHAAGARRDPIAWIFSISRNREECLTEIWLYSAAQGV